MENAICQEVADNDIQWKFQEILQLLRSFKEHGLNFQQISTKMKGNAESNKRSKNFYTPEVCESAFKKILSISKEKPFFVDLFKTMEYSEEAHGVKLLEQYEDYHTKVTEFVDKTLLNDKFKNMLVAMENGQLSPENTEKMVKFCQSFPSMVRGIDEYDKIMEKKSIFEALMPERDEITKFDELKLSLNAKCEELQKQKEIEKDIEDAVSVSPGTPKGIPPRLGSVEPIAPAEEVKLRKRRASVATKKTTASKKSLTHRESTPTTCDAETQTYICLLVKFDGPQLPPMIDNSKKAVNTKSNQKTRNVMTQTGKIYFNFNNDFETFKWYDFGNVPSEMAVELANSCLRSDHDFESDKPIKVNMYFDDSNKFDDPYLVKLKKHPLYKVLVDIQEADSGGFFKYPVKIEVPDYPSWIKNPMDLLTIEDLMIEGKIKDINDLEIYCHLITTNAVVFAGIPAEAEEFAEKLINIFHFCFNIFAKIFVLASIIIFL
uniref:Bromo domain-containing protein n=1 Tax=Panagrolaimus superbus TaxID=310955 RepID=A0A914Z214_9BILA